jgi:hypothetical protein
MGWGSLISLDATTLGLVSALALTCIFYTACASDAASVCAPAVAAALAASLAASYTPHRTGVQCPDCAPTRV